MKEYECIVCGKGTDHDLAFGMMSMIIGTVGGFCPTHIDDSEELVKAY
ncbi:MAG: hypothetical protein KJ709_01935 [Nanoarchaeota archaeon]|nr:hypothetical protein [Nanoarchaeota archaeon]